MIVTCDICGHHHDEASPDVRYIRNAGAWVCADEAACFDRKPETAGPWIFGTRESPCCGMAGRKG